MSKIVHDVSVQPRCDSLTADIKVWLPANLNEADYHKYACRDIITDKVHIICIRFYNETDCNLFRLTFGDRYGERTLSVVSVIQNGVIE